MKNCAMINFNTTFPGSKESQTPWRNWYMSVTRHSEDNASRRVENKSTGCCERDTSCAPVGDHINTNNQYLGWFTQIKNYRIFPEATNTVSFVSSNSNRPGQPWQTIQSLNYSCNSTSCGKHVHPFLKRQICLLPQKSWAVPKKVKRKITEPESNHGNNATHRINRDVRW
jgi:hypothetical protein